MQTIGKNIQNENKNKSMCLMLNSILKNFFDDIYIPIKYFKFANWDIKKVLSQNYDVLFYHHKYLSEDDNNFNKVFEKYYLMIIEIMTPENKLYYFLKKWSQENNYQKSYLKSLLTSEKYQLISPLLIVNKYIEYHDQYNDDYDKTKETTELFLDELVKKVKKEIKKFKKKFRKLVESYVYNRPLDDDLNLYISGFIKQIIKKIIKFANKLLNFGVYAIHPLILEIIDYYLPLDEIYYYDASII